MPQTDTYIEKDASINDEIDRLRHAATSALFERRDVIIVASVSCIYGLGSPEDYQAMTLSLRHGDFRDRDLILRKLVGIQYERNDVGFRRGTFRVRGDVIEIFPAYQETMIRIEFFGDEVDRILEIDPITGEVLGERETLHIYPASHYVTPEEKLKRALAVHRAGAGGAAGRAAPGRGSCWRPSAWSSGPATTWRCSGRWATATASRTTPGTCRGGSRGSPRPAFSTTSPGTTSCSSTSPTRPSPRWGLCTTATCPARRPWWSTASGCPRPWTTGRLSSRSLSSTYNQVIFVSATPGPYERRLSTRIVEQIIRPTGLVDPEVVVRPVKGQIDDLIHEIRQVTARNERVLVTTLTKKMAEDLTDYLQEMGIRVRYLHSEIAALERVEILRDLRLGKFDVLVGINLLREGLDLPEVSLVAILDADKEGFLRSETSLIQTIGRAARNVNGRVILYADQITDSMRAAIEETRRRREIQLEYNRKHGITPETVRKQIRDIVQDAREEEARQEAEKAERIRRRAQAMRPEELARQIQELEEQMYEAAKKLEFERAAELRDEIKELRDVLTGLGQLHGWH